MTRSPAGDDPPIEGGGAAERLRQFLQARSPGAVRDAIADRGENEEDDATAPAVEDKKGCKTPTAES